MAQTEKGRRREAERRQLEEERRKRTELLAVERMAKREATRAEDEKREADVSKWYDQSRFQSLLQARGPNDPTVRQAATEGGFALPDAPAAPTYRDQIDKFRAEQDAKNEAARIELEREQLRNEGLLGTPQQATPLAPGGNKLAALGTLPDPLEEQKTVENPADIYQGRIKRPGGPAEGYRFFTDNPAAQPQGLQGGLGKFTATRMAGPQAVGPAPPPVAPIATTGRDNYAMRTGTGDIAAANAGMTAPQAKTFQPTAPARHAGTGPSIAEQINVNPVAGVAAATQGSFTRPVVGQATPDYEPTRKIRDNKFIRKLLGNPKASAPRMNYGWDWKYGFGKKPKNYYKSTVGR